MVVHVVNLDYDAAKDAVKERTDVRLDVRGLPAPMAREARLLRYNGDPLALSVEVEGEVAKVRIPELRLWSIVAFE